MRRHEKASSARSTQRQASGLGRFLVAVLVALALIPASASAITTRPVLGFSPITGTGTGVTLHDPTGIAVDESNGNVFVNDGGFSSGNVVDIFNAEGGVPVGVASPYRITGFNFSFEPNGAAVDNSATSPNKGVLYVADVANGKLKKFVRNGGTELYEAAGELTPSSGPAFYIPPGVAVDSKGNVFVADWGSGSVVEFSPAGTQLARINTEAALGRPSALAIDAAGDLFVQSYSNGSVHKYTANGSGEIEEAVHTQVVSSGARGVAVDTATNSLYVALGNHVTQYDATTLAQQLEFGAGKLGNTARIAVNSATGNIYVVDRGKTNVVAFGPIATVPDVNAGAVTGLSGTAATLNGIVNPDGVAVTNCKFEYGTTASYGSSTPCVGAIPTDSANHSVSASLSGLDLHTTYHWRIVASNANGANETNDQSFTTQGPVVKEAWTNDVTATEATVKAKINPGVAGLATTYHVEYGTDTSYGQSTAEKNVGADEADHIVGETLTGLAAGTTYHWRAVATNSAGSVEGPDRSFITTAPSSAETTCPNQQFRTGASANLPDCRAYEMVSPVDKKGGNIYTKGQGIYALWAGLNQSSVSGEKFTYSSYRAFGDAQSAPYSSQYLATRTANGWSNHGISAPHSSPFSTHPGLLLENEYKLFSPDLSAGVFMYNDKFLQLTADSAPAEVPTIYRRDLDSGDYEPLLDADTGLVPPVGGPPFPEPQASSADAKHIAFAAGSALTPDASTAGNRQTYEWSNGELHLISVLPNGTASTSSRTEAGFGNNNNEGETRYGNVVHAVSEDGSRVFWTDWGLSKIFLRKNAQAEQSTSGCEAGKACTVPVSDSSFAAFVAADPNGTRAIYIENGDLWEFDVASETRSLIVSEMVGYPLPNDDLSRIYLISKKDLAAGATAGKLNLYLVEEGAFTLVAIMDDTDQQGLNSFLQLTALRVGRVTPDGGNVAFMSKASLPTVNFPGGYDNTDSANGETDSELYVYDADSGELTCASCRPSGARPSGGRPITYGANIFATEPTPQAAAWINPWSMQYYAQRALSDDGNRFYFNAYDAILPQDTNGKQDVYQWEAQGSGSCEKAGGCVSLISSGKSPENSEFWDASPSGNDVFIRTLSSLLPQDNGLVDVYDARVNGGFPQPGKIAACEGEACQSTPAPLNDPTPSSSTYRGPGNVADKPARKKKHHKAKKKQRSKKQSRAANNSRRAHR